MERGYCSYFITVIIGILMEYDSGRDDLVVESQSKILLTFGRFLADREGVKHK